MKKITTTSIGLFFILFASAQLPVSHVAGNKQALIEEFTGNTCVACPLGAKLLDQITTANPQKAFSVALHAGHFATPDPSSSSLDFRTPDGDSILNMPNIGIVSYPGAVFNRTPPTAYSPQIPGGLAMNYTAQWTTQVNSILLETTYVNIAGEAHINSTTREMTVYIQAYYTANCPVPNNRLSVALLQNNIIAYQKGANNYPAMQVGSDYRHNHVLRDIISNGPLGEIMAGPKTAGSTFSTAITYTVAATYPASGSKTIPAILADLKIIAWISETDRTIMAVCEVPITISSSTGISISDPNENIISIYPNPVKENATISYTAETSGNVSIEIINALGQTVKSERFNTLSKIENLFKIDMSDFCEGLYMINISEGDKIFSKSILVE